MSQELNAKVIRLQSNLQRINAPNMRAVDKYVEIVGVVSPMYKYIYIRSVVTCTCTSVLYMY